MIAEVMIGGAVVGVAGLAWALARPRLIFRVTIALGGPPRVKGQVPRGFASIVAEAARRNQIDSGWVGARPAKDRGRGTLVFSSGLPASFRQQLRNEWANAR